ncbi:hypothetical protein [Cellulosimicrobium protaetiae]|uniref:Lipoprotein n=1 Tax=Cellulosimicrobium protaetiae TaxID=2587808 RepID=A0A6M5UI31_9MICO|nr:hypothetical protein [Cellulosimicrobium protaetiae]QJW36768.1 hypothetical protein FIC82_011770 [Cellulosimicrobium protaetiae]
MRAKRWAVVTTAVLGAVVLGGCDGDGDGEAGAAPQAPAAAEVGDAAGDSAAEDAAACAAYGDVLTILENADIGLADGRMEAQEHDGWYRLATRVLDRLPSGGDSAVQTAIGELQEAAPVASGASAEPTGVHSPEWDDAEADLGDACDAVGAPLTIAVFTGG